MFYERFAMFSGQLRKFFTIVLLAGFALLALVSAIPKMQDRGAFMSINSSLQQFAGGVAAAVGGLIVTQKTKQSPLEHYDTLGYVIVGLSVICVYMVYRVSRIIKQRKQTAPVKIPEPVLAE